MEATYILLTEWFLRLTFGVLVVFRKRSPTAVLSWLAVIAFLPFFGALVYVLIGENRLGLKRSRRYGGHIAINPPALDAQRMASIVQPEIPEPFQSVATLAEALGAYPTRGGNQLELLTETDKVHERLSADIHAAKHHCHLLYYIINPDATAERIGKALSNAVSRGVKCRVLADAVGARDFFRHPMCRAWREAGVEVIEIMPASLFRAAASRIDLRNHRKMAVIDGAIGYTGSHNISNPIYPRKRKYGAWVDASIRVSGPVVYQLQEVFLQDWAFSTEPVLESEPLFATFENMAMGTSPVQVLPTGPHCETSPLVDVILQAVRVAHRKLTFTTPYFVPDDTIVAAMRSAALRGLEVVLIVPRYSDHRLAQAAGRSHYGFLMDVGVQIHEYRAGLLHSKTLTVDDAFAIIGSANLDVRSFLLNFELATLVYDSNFASQLHFLQQEYLRLSEPLSLRAWRKRGPHCVFGDNLAKLASPLL